MRQLMMIFTFLVLFSLFVTAENATAPKLCTDTDSGGANGKDSALKQLGSVKYGITPLSDTCLTSEEGVRTNSSKWLREYYCENDQRKEKVYDCTKFGYDQCSNGVCIGGGSNLSSSSTKDTTKPASACGNKKLEKDKGEQCDPPGGICFGKTSKQYGVCNPDCTCKIASSAEQVKAVCGDETIDSGEDCEKDSDCGGSGQVCSSCKCVKQLTKEEIEALKNAAKANKTPKSEEVEKKYPDPSPLPQVNLTATNFTDSPALQATSAVSSFFKSIFSWLGKLFS